MKTMVCAHCGKPMVPDHWRRRLTGVAFHGGHGLCRPCYRAGRRPRGSMSYKPGVGDPDMVIVWRVLGGEQLRMNSAEFESVVAHWTRHGRSTSQIARALGCTERTVTRYRARIRAVNSRDA